MSWLSPSDTITEQERASGLKHMYYDGLCSHAMALLVTGAFLPGMALALGASNFVIGLLASLAPMAQMAQIPAIFAVEKVPQRKLLTVFFALVARIALIAAALIPFLAPEDNRVFLFTSLMVIFFLSGSVAGCAWSSWIKDLVPANIMGSYMGKRLAAATALGAALSIIAGFSVDSLAEWLGHSAKAYGIIFVMAALFGLYGANSLTKVAEPRMPPPEPGANFLKSLLGPIKDANFRRLLFFSMSWSFTVIMGGAFFAVYMLNRIGIPMSGVILLAVISQVTNIYFFKIWGSIADRYSNKSVLAVSVPLFIVILLLFPFTTLPERYSLTIPLLIIIHIIGGISTAGFNLCAPNIALRLAPHGKATAYLGTNAFCTGGAATVAPLIGGVVGSFFAVKEISFRFSYKANAELAESGISFSALNFRGLDFVFFAAAIAGVYAYYRLSLIEEEGTVSEAAVREEIRVSVRNSFINTSGLSMGMRRMTAFPYDLLRRTGGSASSKMSRAARSGINQARKIAKADDFNKSDPGD